MVPTWWLCLQGHPSPSWSGGLQASEESPGFALSAARKRTQLADSEFGGKNRLWLWSWLRFLLRVLPWVSSRVCALVTREQQHWVEMGGDSEAREGHCQLVVVWESGTLVLSYLVSVPGLGFVMGPAFSTRGSKSWA